MAQVFRPDIFLLGGSDRVLAYIRHGCVIKRSNIGTFGRDHTWGATRRLGSAPLSGWTLVGANAISDTGWIAGYGMFDPDGPGSQEAYQRLFLLQMPTRPGD